MTVFVQGKKFTLKANFTGGAIFSKPVWATTPPGQVTITPSADGLSCDCVPVIDNTVEAFTVTATAQNDANDPTKTLTLTFNGQDAFTGATGGSLDVVAG